MNPEDLKSILADIADLQTVAKEAPQPTRGKLASTLFLLKQKIVALKGANTDERPCDSP